MNDLIIFLLGRFGPSILANPFINNIDNTLKNINLADEVIAESNDSSEIQNMKERNERREVALNKMRSEIKEEAMANKNNLN